MKLTRYIAYFASLSSNLHRFSNACCLNAALKQLRRAFDPNVYFVAIVSTSDSDVESLKRVSVNQEQN